MTITQKQEAALPHSEIVVSLVLAIVTAVAGLVMALMVAPPSGRARLRLPSVDRQAAEGGDHVASSMRIRNDPPASAREAPGYVPYSSDAPSAPALSPPVFGLRLPSPSPSLDASASPTPSPRVALAAPSPRGPPAPPPPPSAPSVVIPAGPPGGAPRPAQGSTGPQVRPTNLPDAWRSIAGAVGIVRTHSADYLGVAIAPEGLFVVARAGAERPDPVVEFGQGPIKARVVVVNHRLDLAVLRLAQPPPAMVSLAEPGALRRGTSLAYAVTADSVERFAEAHVMGVHANGSVEVLHYLGLTLEATRGSPMVTSSGTLAGVVVSRGWELVGGAYSLAAPPVALARVIAEASAAGGGTGPPPRLHGPPVSHDLQRAGMAMISDSLGPPQIDQSAPPLTIVPAVRLGTWYLGMPLQEAAQTLAPSGSAEPLGEGILLHHYNEGRIGLVGIGGKVVAAFTQDPHYGSIHGIGAGMQLDQLPLDRVVPNVTVVHDPHSGDRVATGEGLELVADSSGRIREVRVLPPPPQGP